MQQGGYILTSKVTNSKKLIVVDQSPLLEHAGHLEIDCKVLHTRQYGNREEQRYRQTKN